MLVKTISGKEIKISNQIANSSPFIIKAFNELGCKDNIAIPLPMSDDSYNFIKQIFVIIKEQEVNKNNIQDTIKLFLDKYQIKDLLEHLTCVYTLKIDTIVNNLVNYLREYYLNGSEMEFRSKLGLEILSDDELDESVYTEKVSVKIKEPANDKGKESIKGKEPANDKGKESIKGKEPVNDKGKESIKGKEPANNEYEDDEPSDEAEDDYEYYECSCEQDECICYE